MCEPLLRCELLFGVNLSSQPLDFHGRLRLEVAFNSQKRHGSFVPHPDRATPLSLIRASLCLSLKSAGIRLSCRGRSQRRQSQPQIRLPGALRWLSSLIRCSHLFLSLGVCLPASLSFSLTLVPLSVSLWEPGRNSVPLPRPGPTHSRNSGALEFLVRCSQWQQIGLRFFPCRSMDFSPVHFRPPSKRLPPPTTPPEISGEGFVFLFF